MPPEESLYFHRGPTPAPDHDQKTMVNMATKVLEHVKRQYHSGDPLQVREARLWLGNDDDFPALVSAQQVMHILGIDSNEWWSHFPAIPQGPIPRSA